MIFLNYLHYPFIILAGFIGLVASWSDLRESKIKNRLIIFGVLTALFFYLAEILILLSFEISPRWLYFRDVLINTFLGFLTGFFLWQFNVWAAGDAKLFALFAFLIPLAYYEKNYLPYFPSFAMMLNIFVVALVFIFLKILFDIFISAIVFLKGFFGFRSQNDSMAEFRNNKAAEFLKNPTGQSNFSIIEKVKTRKKIFKEFLLMPVFSFGIFIALSVIFRNLQGWGALGELAFLDQPVFLFLSMFIIFQVLNKTSRPVKKGLAFSFLIYLAFGLRLWPGVISAAFFDVFQFQTLYFIFGFLILNKLIDFYIEKKDVSRIPLEKLKPQMILTPRNLEKLREFAADLEVNSDGLTEEDLKIIRDLGEKNPEFRFFEIYKTTPMAPFIFLGVILTLILKGSLISLII